MHTSAKWASTASSRICSRYDERANDATANVGADDGEANDGDEADGGGGCADVDGYDARSGADWAVRPSCRDWAHSC